jgi:cephalosporin hydroxylase
MPLATASCASCARIVPSVVLRKDVWRTTSWCGVPLLKSVSDLWNYQEIIVERRPSLIIEFGSHAGGSALFFAHVLQAAGLNDSRIISIDLSHALLDARARACRTIEFIESSSTATTVARIISDRRAERAGSTFVILDSDHTEENVYNELISLRPIVSSGDYVVVDDTNINGHPVLPDFGPGPHEALTRYKREFPNDYIQHRIRESEFGFANATDGFLIRVDRSERDAEPSAAPLGSGLSIPKAYRYTRDQSGREAFPGGRGLSMPLEQNQAACAFSCRVVDVESIAAQPRCEHRVDLRLLRGSEKRNGAGYRRLTVD